MHQPQQRASRLRAVALASTVALAVALPLAAAVAGEDARLAAEAAHEPGPEGGAATPGGPPSAASQPSSGERSASEREQAGGRGDSGGADDKSLSRLDVPRMTGAVDSSRPSSSCGPEITSPEGVEAQTCVLTEGGDTWARTYYRNATNSRLSGVLTLMRPDGRTTRVHCSLAAADEPGICETPRHPTVRTERTRGEGPYSAVAEVAPADGERLLLRAGSNSPEGSGS